jgi:peptidoglycan/xylan/chitin deacetylase (PgdA/CDA1 family)
MAMREHVRKPLDSLAKRVAFFAYLYSGYPRLRDLILSWLGLAPMVVLCYHRIGGCGSMSKTPDQFRRDLAYLRQHYDCITLRELCTRLQNNESCPRRTAVVTFDDGYRDNFTAALPLLKAAKVPATFFVNPGFVGRDRMFPHDNLSRAEAFWRYGPEADYRKMSWDELREAQSAGFEIGSHTVNHVDLGKVDAEVVRREVSDSLAILNDELGQQSRSFAFPWGRQENCPPYAVTLVREAGYYGAVRCMDRTNSRRTDPFRVCRIDAGNGHVGALELRARLAGFNPGCFGFLLQWLSAIRNPNFLPAGPVS